MLDNPSPLWEGWACPILDAHCRSRSDFTVNMGLIARMFPNQFKSVTSLWNACTSIQLFQTCDIYPHRVFLPYLNRPQSSPTRRDTPHMGTKRFTTGSFSPRIYVVGSAIGEYLWRISPPLRGIAVRLGLIESVVFALEQLTLQSNYMRVVTPA
jgi:hypothetical protein